ncbi:unnamed protein product [Cyprideis torosa]|uniref:Uncharacterized protein n=1 Tax=Cyprideis torosa TaxID=163714 RepID=A0A7R8ZIZ0_9CRUS|nr:unnamed protein product [Cyprideis torosa]CAG0881104.1 unnamed protein product [Cyprideis torosa]
MMSIATPPSTVPSFRPAQPASLCMPTHGASPPRSPPPAFSPPADGHASPELKDATSPSEAEAKETSDDEEETTPSSEAPPTSTRQNYAPPTTTVSYSRRNKRKNFQPRSLTLSTSLEEQEEGEERERRTSPAPGSDEGEDNDGGGSVMPMDLSTPTVTRSEDEFQPRNSALSMRREEHANQMERARHTMEEILSIYGLGRGRQQTLDLGKQMSTGMFDPSQALCRQPAIESDRENDLPWDLVEQEFAPGQRVIVPFGERIAE